VVAANGNPDPEYVPDLLFGDRDREQPTNGQKSEDGLFRPLYNKYRSTALISRLQEAEQLLTIARKQAGKREFAERYALTSRQQIENAREFLANDKSKAGERGQRDGRKRHLLENPKIQFHGCTSRMPQIRLYG
jgi:hypothetical protein